MHLPLYIELKNKKVLVFGLGEVGQRRAKKLRDHGANVKGIDGEEVDLVGVEVEKKRIEKHNIPSLDKYFLVVASTSDKDLNKAIAEKAKSSNVLVSCAGFFEEGDLIFPGLVESEKDKISITTMGDDPSLTKEIKGVIDNEFPQKEDEKTS